MYKLFTEYVTYTHFPKVPFKIVHHLSSSVNSQHNRGAQFSDIITLESDSSEFVKPTSNNKHTFPQVVTREPVLQATRPWTEWRKLIERLLNKGYFSDGSCPSNINSLGAKDYNRIRTACLNFARDRYDLVRYLSRVDIKVIVQRGCPSLDRKVVNSGKRLRAFVGIDEGEVCSLCNWRGNCERAYIKSREDEGGRTVDVVRILLNFGLDSTMDSLENTLIMNKALEDSVRKLLNDILELSTREIAPDLQNETLKLQESSVHEQRLRNQSDLSTKKGDWTCPRCNFLNFAKNIRCLRCDELFQDRLDKLRWHEDHLPLKKGDWICEKCNFLNFAKNVKCLQCKEKPSNRKLNPGEWECISCHYINFRRNMVCLRCDWKRPKSSNDTNQRSPETQNLLDSTRLTFVKNDDELSGSSFSRRRPGRDLEHRDYSDDGNGFVDSFPSELEFPIVGGKTDISRDPLKHKKWRENMANKRKDPVDSSKEIDERLVSSKFPKSFKIFESSNDDYEEMAGWFGHGKL